MLAKALDEWDERTVDRAATAAARELSQDELFEILWPIGARDFHNIGHKMIHTTQAYRALRCSAGSSVNRSFARSLWV